LIDTLKLPLMETTKEIFFF